MTTEQATPRLSKVIYTRFDPELVERMEAEARARTTMTRKVTIVEVIREAVYDRYFKAGG